MRRGTHAEYSQQIMYSAVIGCGGGKTAGYGTGAGGIWRPEVFCRRISLFDECRMPWIYVCHVFCSNIAGAGSAAGIPAGARPFICCLQHCPARSQEFRVNPVTDRGILLRKRRGSLICLGLLTAAVFCLRPLGMKWLVASPLFIEAITISEIFNKRRTKYETE